MSNAPRTLIGIIRDHVTAWRKAKSWSRESVVAEIVGAHERIGGPDLTGIRFEPQTRDTYDRMKVNADRVFRWLDDETKDSNLLPPNFLQSLLAAMPPDVLISCVADLLRPLGLVPQPIGCAADGSLNAAVMLRGVMKEGGEAEQALLQLVAGPNTSALLSARKELTESIRAQEEALSAVDAQLARVTQNSPMSGTL
jgi:hypothetical protein